MAKNDKRKPKFKVGDWVYIVNGPHRLLALITEDQGPLGQDGEHIYSTREFPLWSAIFDSGASEHNLEPAERPAKLPEPHDKLPVP